MFGKWGKRRNNNVKKMEKSEKKLDKKAGGVTFFHAVQTDKEIL